MDDAAATTDAARKFLRDKVLFVMFGQPFFGRNLVVNETAGIINDGLTEYKTGGGNPGAGGCVHTLLANYFAFAQ